MNREALVPLDDQLAQLIRDQQARVQGDYPAGQTVLFPQAQANRDGRKPMHDGAYRRALYSWLARCDIRDERGNPARITPHQWRHILSA
jgi:integrase